MSPKQAKKIQGVNVSMQLKGLSVNRGGTQNILFNIFKT
jgi:hypothetical protein